MPSVPARFRVGFASNTEYAMLTDQNKAAFKNAVEAEIKERVRESDLASWNGLVITVDAAGHKAEAAVQDDISTHLTGVKQPDGSSANLTIDPQAGIRYAIWDNTRICVHEYFLNRAGTDWKVPQTYTNQMPNPHTVEVQLYGALEWDTPL